MTSELDAKGTGIGPYMSTQIAEKLGGTLSVKNVEDAAMFSLNV